MAMNLTQSVTLSPDALHQEVMGETVILDLASETYFGLDEVGTRIWQLLEKHGRLQPVLDTLLEEYDVDAKQLTEDMEDLLTKLHAAGLVKLDAE